MTPPLSRRLLAEFTSTGLLVAVVVGSGIAAQIIGGAIGTPLVVITHPVPSRTTRADQPTRLAG